MDATTTNVATLIADLAARLGSISAVADRAGVSRSLLSMVRSGARKPTANLVEALEPLQADLDTEAEAEAERQRIEAQAEAERRRELRVQAEREHEVREVQRATHEEKRRAQEQRDRELDQEVRLLFVVLVAVALLVVGAFWQVVVGAVIFLLKALAVTVLIPLLLSMSWRSGDHERGQS